MNARRRLFEAYCDGQGQLICHCGGDLCVCGLDGEQCVGCEKCEDGPDDIIDGEPDAVLAIGRKP